MVGVRLVSVPVDHQHVLMQAVPGHEVPRGSPCFRDPDNLVYGKDEAGGMLIGGYEADPVVRWTDGVPWDHGASPVQSDMDRFAPLLEGAIRRFPFLDRAGVIRLLCHPDAMTPDANPLLGPMPGHARLLGRRRPVAERLRRRGRDRPRARRVDHRRRAAARLNAYRAWRFGNAYHDPWFATAAAREAYRYYYRLRLSVRQPTSGRAGCAPARSRAASRSSARCSGARTAGSAPTISSPSNRWRRSGADQRRFGWAKPPWFERVAARARGLSRARRDHRHDFVRQARGQRSRCACAARARLRQPHRPAGVERDLHPVPQPPRRDRRRRDRDANRSADVSA